MTITYNGNDYNIIYQAGELIQMTTAFRLSGKSVEIVQIDNYVRLGEVQVTETTLNLQDLKDIVNKAELLIEQRNQEEQLVLHAELNKAAEGGEAA